MVTVKIGTIWAFLYCSFFTTKSPLGLRGRCSGWVTRPERMRSIDASHGTERIVRSVAPPDRTFGSYRGPFSNSDTSRGDEESSRRRGRCLRSRERAEQEELPAEGRGGSPHAAAPPCPASNLALPSPPSSPSATSEMGKMKTHSLVLSRCSGEETEMSASRPLSGS